MGDTTQMITFQVIFDPRRQLDSKLDRAIKDFPDVSRKAIQKIGDQAKFAAQELSPIGKTGKFSASWRYRTKRVGDGEYTLELTNVDPKAPLVLYPTRPHYIFPKNGKALRFVMGGEFVFRKHVLHPGTPGQNVFQLVAEDDALESVSAQIIEEELRLFSKSRL